jgi:uncharacterized protein
MRYSAAGYRLPMNGPSTEHPRHAPLWAMVCDQCSDADLAHDGYHVMRVYRWALRLSSEAAADPDIAGAAALVHDLVNIPKESVDRPLGSALSAAASQGILADAGYSATEIESVVEAVRTASWSRGLAPTTPEGTVLQDADRLDAIGAIGIARTFATAQSMRSRGQPGRFYDPADPLGRSGRPLDDRRQPVDHFRVKLLRLAEGMHLDAARAEATRRHAAMEAFLAALAREVDLDVQPG